MERDDLEIKHVQINLTPEQHEALGNKAAQAKMKPTPFARELFLRFLEENKGAVPERNARWHALLDRVLEKGSKTDRELITGALKLCGEAISGREASARDAIRKHDSR